ncbi:MAG TPA: hypothetical protein VH436_28210 [Vicinamibacterales bacterium]|jgi:hypothetical protein
MIGAFGMHIVNAEFPRVVPPLVLGGLAFFAYWSSRRSGEQPSALTRRDAVK